MKRLITLLFIVMGCSASLAQQARQVQHFAHRGSR